jgi:hypothetical protein
MPEVGGWTYFDVTNVVVNIEYLTRQIYDAMAQSSSYNPNREYADRLMRVLAQLQDAADNMVDQVYANDDYIDSLNDLFYLASVVALAESTLDGYSQAYRVNDEMHALRYYVDELLWVYREAY